MNYIYVIHTYKDIMNYRENFFFFSGCNISYSKELISYKGYIYSPDMNIKIMWIILYILFYSETLICFFHGLIDCSSIYN